MVFAKRTNSFPVRAVSQDGCTCGRIFDHAFVGLSTEQVCLVDTITLSRTRTHIFPAPAAPVLDQGNNVAGRVANLPSLTGAIAYEEVTTGFLVRNKLPFAVGGNRCTGANVVTPVRHSRLQGPLQPKPQRRMARAWLKDRPCCDCPWKPRVFRTQSGEF